jgi:hypothetical protein
VTDNLGESADQHLSVSEVMCVRADRGGSFFETRRTEFANWVMLMTRSWNIYVDPRAERWLKAAGWRSRNGHPRHGC